MENPNNKVIKMWIKALGHFAMKKGVLYTWYAHYEDGHKRVSDDKIQEYTRGNETGCYLNK